MKVSNLPTQTSAQALDSLTKTLDLSRKDSKTEGVKSSTSVLFKILSSTATPATKISGILEDFRSERVSNLRGIQPYDFNRAVRANGILTADSCGNDMLLASREPLQKETEHVARQIALWIIKHGADRDGTSVRPTFSDAKAGNDYLELAARIDQTLTYDSTKDRYLTSSGLYVQPPSVWSSMKLNKHTIMRLCPMIDFEVQSKRGESDLRGTGKIYADYFDHTTVLGKRFGLTQVGQGDLAETDSDSFIDPDLLSQAMMSAKSLIPSVLKFMAKQYLEESAAAAENTPELSRPPIVDCASEDESQRYVSQSSFDDGHWELTLPDVVLGQMEHSSKHSTDDPEVKQQFIFVQDLDGNLKLSIHQDKSYHHSTPEGGRPIRTAGELFGKVSVRERDGKLVLRVDELCNKSGHYWPTLDTFAALRDDLIESGLDASTLTFKTITNSEEVQELMDDWSNPDLASHVPAELSSLSTAQHMITTAHAELIGSKRNAGEGSFPRTESAPVQSGSNMEQLFPH